MTEINKPNTQQATDGDLGGKMTDVLSRWLRDEVDGMIPARVVSYDDATNRATIKPLVMIGTTDGQKVSRAPLDNIPVYRFGGGGFFMRFPLKPGDLGWLVAGDRDISLVMQAGGGEDWPNTTRLHCFGDGVFLPDSFKEWVISGADAEACVLQSLDGQVVVALAQDAIELRVGAQVLRLDALGLFHNGINIGSTHRHTGVTTGSGTSGTPT